MDVAHLRSRILRKWRTAGIGAGLLIALHAGAKADYKDEIGYTQLVLELGAAVPTGAGVTVTQVEAAEGTAYAPDSSNPELADKSYVLKSGISGVSGHATAVAINFFGTSTSIAPGVLAVDVYEANNWVQSGMLNFGDGVPQTEVRDVANFSFIGSTGNELDDQEVTRRFDYTIQQSNYVAVVGTNNGDSDIVPALLAHNYNGITVGKSDAQHASGFTSFDEPGRVKPDIVAPPSTVGGNFTSFTTPIVSAAAVLLIQVARSDASLANGADSPSIKAILLAGATKTEFPTWTHTSATPLDTTYGAGELNIYNSYHILAAGEQGPGTASTVGTQGWDFGTISTADLLYFFEVPATMTLNEFSVALTWNRIIADSAPGPNFVPTAFVDNLDLRLFSATSFTLGAMLDSSVSTVDNVEYLYLPVVAAGRYAFEINHGTGTTQYAIAWTGNLTPTVPELSTSWVLIVSAGTLCLSRRRSK